MGRLALEVATKLRRARESAGVSQRELARRLGVPQNRVAAIERGSALRLNTLTDVATALGMRLELEVRPIKGRS